MLNLGRAPLFIFQNKLVGKKCEMINNQMFGHPMFRRRSQEFGTKLGSSWRKNNLVLTSLCGSGQGLVWVRLTRQQKHIEKYSVLVVDRGPKEKYIYIRCVIWIQMEYCIIRPSHPYWFAFKGLWGLASKSLETRRLQSTVPELSCANEGQIFQDQDPSKEKTRKAHMNRNAHGPPNLTRVLSCLINPFRISLHPPLSQFHHHIITIKDRKSVV